MTQVTHASCTLSLHCRLTANLIQFVSVPEFEKSAKAESSEYLDRLHKELLLLISSVYIVNKTGDIPVPWMAPVDVVFT